MSTKLNVYNKHFNYYNTILYECIRKITYLQTCFEYFRNLLPGKCSTFEKSIILPAIYNLALFHFSFCWSNIQITTLTLFFIVALDYDLFMQDAVLLLSSLPLCLLFATRWQFKNYVYIYLYTMLFVILNLSNIIRVCICLLSCMFN